MAVAALLSMALIVQVTGRLDDLTQSYVPAYGALARADVSTLERALALRRMVIEKMQSPANSERFAEIRNSFEKSGKEVDTETQVARTLLDTLIAKGSRFGDTTTLVRLETRLVDLMNHTRADLNEEVERLLPLLDTGDQKAIADHLERVDALRDEFDRGLGAVRADSSLCLRPIRRRQWPSSIR
jgi:adenylate cyclase